MIVLEQSVQMDLSETALDEARHRIGVATMGSLKVFVADYWALTARRLQAVHGFELVVVPDCLLKTPITWGAQFGAEIFWSHPET